MSNPKTGYIAIRDAAAQALYELEEQGSHKLQRAIYYAIQCVKELNFTNRADVKTIRLPVNDNKTVDLPVDYIDHTKLGVLVGTRYGNRILTFSMSDDIILGDVVDDCGNRVPSATVDSTCGCTEAAPADGFWYNNYENGRAQGRLMGYGGGRNYVGEYRKDSENDRLVFNSDMNFQHIYMEYITNGIDPSGKTYIHAYYEFSIITYIIWKLTKNPSERAKKESEHYRARKQMRSLRLAFTKREYLLATRKSFGRTVKT